MVQKAIKHSGMWKLKGKDIKSFIKKLYNLILACGNINPNAKKISLHNHSQKNKPDQ